MSDHGGVSRPENGEIVLKELREAIRPEVKAEVDALRPEIKKWVRAESRRESRRYRLNQYVTYGVIVVLIVLGFWRVSGIQDHQNENRYAVALAACKDRNKIARGLREFVNAAAPQLNSLARRQFEIEPSCKRYAHSILTTGKSPK